MYLPTEDFQETSDPVPVGVEYSMFAEPGQAPTIGETALKVPLAVRTLLDLPSVSTNR